MGMGSPGTGFVFIPKLMLMSFGSLLTSYSFVIHLLRFLLYSLEGKKKSIKFVQNYLSLVIYVNFFRDIIGIYPLFSLFIIISIKQCMHIFLLLTLHFTAAKLLYLCISQLFFRVNVTDIFII